MLLAAGEGRRLRPLTEIRPKPLIEVAGRPMIDHLLDRVTEAGIEEVVVNTHYLGEQIAQYLAGRAEPRITFSPEPALLDTGGGVRHALPLLGPDPFFVLNTDCFWVNGTAPTLRRMAERWNPAEMDALLLLHRTAAVLTYGGQGHYTMDQDGRLHRRLESQVAPYLYAGVMLIAPDAVARMTADSFAIYEVWDRLEAEDRLYGLVHEGLWFHVSTPDDLTATTDWLTERSLFT